MPFSGCELPLAVWGGAVALTGGCRLCCVLFVACYCLAYHHTPVSTSLLSYVATSHVYIERRVL